MNNLIKTFQDYYNQRDFRKFQNTLAENVYKTLSTSYSNSDNEVNMVTKMCDTVNGEEFKGLKFYVEKIHGARSLVEFYNKNEPITKELADMVIISVATQNQNIIYEKTAFIQNKKEKEDGSKNWEIDQDQLFLLHNFPTFKGKKGIFNKYFKNEVIFLNRSKTLGNYGLFQEPGEMILLSALMVYRLQNENKISLSDIRKYTNNDLKVNDLLCSPLIDEFKKAIIEHFPQCGLPFLNNSICSFNIYEFIRNLSLFNIGETVISYSNIFDKELAKFNQILLDKSGLSEKINIIKEKSEDSSTIKDNLTILLVHLNLDDENKNIKD